MEKNEGIGKSPKPKKVKRHEKIKTPSIFFLLWAVFSVFALCIVLFFGISQQVLMGRIYKSEAAKELTAKGTEIRTALKTDEANMDRLFRFLAVKHDVNIFWLNESGDVLFPSGGHSGADSPEFEEYLDFETEIVTIKNKLKKAVKEDKDFVVYEGNSEFIYASEMTWKGGVKVYLYVSQSIQFIEAGVSQMGVRTALSAVFVLVLAFAVSSAVSGWLTKPIAEMTKKAHLLAQGNFDVDFYGKNYGEEMVELADTLNYARDEISKADTMQKELIANVSHDFKTPLTMIKAYASMIMEISGDIPEKRNKHAQVIVDEADKLTSLVKDVLDLSKIRSGIDQLKLARFDLSESVKEILSRFAYYKDEQGYRFIADLETELYVVADERKIEQAIYNLIGNSVNYTGENKTVYVSLKKQQNGEIYFAVTDTGKGIKDEEIKDIWDRYYRSGEAHKRPIQGTGLGLSIVKTVLQKHGFAFGVDSTLGVGSTFYVVFPPAEENNLDSK